MVDGGSTDDTPDLARRAGAEVRPQAELMPHSGPVLGKGDAMWRALTAMHGDIVVFVDGDSGEIFAGNAGVLMSRLSEYEAELRDWATKAPARQQA